MRQLGPAGHGATRRLWPLILWTVIILLLVLPWRSWQNHSHWARVQWLPFITPPVRVRDIVGNVLLYTPFGYLAVRLWRVPRTWQPVLLAGVLSVLTEFAQVYSHGRFPSLGDVTCNVCGAWLGVRLSRRH